LGWSLREPDNGTGKDTGNVISFIAWLFSCVNPQISVVFLLRENVRREVAGGELAWNREKFVAAFYIATICAKSLLHG
jgi:hypothetical protein